MTIVPYQEVKDGWTTVGRKRNYMNASFKEVAKETITHTQTSSSMQNIYTVLHADDNFVQDTLNIQKNVVSNLGFPKLVVGQAPQKLNG